jgi:uncharacterized membrane protein
MDSLESRLLLSTVDLAGALGAIRLPDPASAGSTGTVQVIVTDTSRAAANGAVGINVYLSSDNAFDAGDTLIGALPMRSSVLKLAGRHSKTFTINVALPSDQAVGDYYNLAVSADTIQVALPYIDLTTNVGRVRLPNHVLPGSTGTASVTITDQGTLAAAGTADVTMYLSTDDAVDGSDIVVGALTGQAVNLAAGRSGTYTVTLAVPADAPAQEYYLLADVQTNGTIVQSDTTNDLGIASRTVTIEAATTDLGGRLTHSTLPASTGAGSTGTVSVSVNNLGNQPVTGAVDVDVYLSATGEVDGSAILIGSGTTTLAALAPNRSQTVTVDVAIDKDTARGSYYLVAQIDSKDAIVESDETNNLAVSNRPIAVVDPVVDLTGWYSRIALGRNPAPGATGNVSLNIFNAGNINVTGSVDVTVYVSALNTLDASAIAVGSTKVDLNVPANRSQSATVAATLPSDLPAGTYYVITVIDAGNTLGDANTANNVIVSYSTITVVTPAAKLATAARRR